MKIALGQFDPVVGDFTGNIKKIAELYERACQAQARLLLTPELSVCGYPPNDFFDRAEMAARNEQALVQLAALTVGKSCALLVGHMRPNSSAHGRVSQNVASIFENGKCVFSQAKSLLPTYDIFDESRYFEPAEKITFWNCDGKTIAVAICEDLWARDLISSYGADFKAAPSHARYSNDPVKTYAMAQPKVDLLISVSSSPFEMGKFARREALHQEIARELGIPLVYVNQVGATDEVLFDGGSFAFDAQGALIGRLPFFKKAFGVVDIGEGEVSFPGLEQRAQADPTDLDLLARGLVMGIREYFGRTGFSKAIVGLSGGLDSAVVATLACQALGAKNVLGIGMPSQYSSSHSLNDAEELAKNLGMRFEVHPIKFLFAAASRQLGEGRGSLSPLALENLQSRLRGLTIMALANHENSLALATGNKSELAMGYCTLYGDTIGALSPIGDVLKTEVYALAEHLNLALAHVIPKNTLIKPPSAELRPDQVDEDSLPPYKYLDPILREYIELGIPVETIVAKHSAQVPRVREFLAKVEINEYKRRQSPFVLKVSPRAFGMGRRIPIAKRWVV